jgi:hypothetical protein
MFRVASQQKDQPIRQAGNAARGGRPENGEQINLIRVHPPVWGISERNQLPSLRSQPDLLTTRGDCPMIILKLTALSALGAGSLVSLFSSEFGPDLVLAILSMVL